MSDFSSMFYGCIGTVIKLFIMIAIVTGIGIAMGYRMGYEKGIKDCNNETIRKQLGI